MHFESAGFKDQNKTKFILAQSFLFFLRNYNFNNFNI